MAEVARLRVYALLVVARARADLQYRLSFALFTLAQCAATLLDLLAIAVIFHQVRRLGGWSRSEVLLLYGMSAVAFGLGDLLASPVEFTAFHVKQGSFDRFLLRPLGPLIQLCSEEFALRRAGKLVQPAVVLAVAVSQVDVHWTLGRVVVLVVSVVSAAAIFSALWVLTAAMSFWTVEAREVANSVTYGGAFLTQYPLDVLSPALRRLAVVVPLAFVTYLPASWLLGRHRAVGLPPASGLAAPLVAAATGVVAAAVWRAGIRHYRSTGS